MNRFVMKLTIISLSIIWIMASFKAESQIPNQGVDLSGFSKNYYSIPFIDLNDRQDIQYIVDKDPEQYLGHPTTHLLKDGKTLLCVYPKGHGKGGIVYKKSYDGGKTWTDRLEVPSSWSTSLEVPTLFPVEDASGKERLIIFSGLFPARMSISEDQGLSWTQLQPLGDWGGIVVMGDLMPLRSGKGHYLTMFHDDGRFFRKEGRSMLDQARTEYNQPLFTLYQTFSYDGGMTWSQPQAILSNRVIHLCEPGLVRSSDGTEIAALLRENSRRMNSFVIFSSDEGKNWTNPRELPNALTGDRHQAIYLDDGRLLISFRDNSPALSRFRQLEAACQNCDPDILYEQAGPVSPTAGDWVAWIGSYEDLKERKEGELRIRLKDNMRGSDCAYPALEKLNDGTIIATTYGHWEPDHPPFILSIQLNPKDLRP